MSVTEPTMICKNCRFSSVERPNPNILQDILICRWGPPTPVLIPTGPGSANLQAMHPSVAPTHWCHRFESYIIETKGI